MQVVTSKTGDVVVQQQLGRDERLHPALCSARLCCAMLAQVPLSNQGFDRQPITSKLQHLPRRFLGPLCWRWATVQPVRTSQQSFTLWPARIA